jgi:regulator of replication initiation timing
MRREVRVAVDLVMDAAEDAQVRQRERHRSALDRTTRQLGDLRDRVAELAAANTGLVGDNASLRGELAEREEAMQREREELALRFRDEQEAAEAEQWEGTTTDVFCCQSCWAFWFLSTAPDRTSSTVRGPFGRHDAACSVCADPLMALPAAKFVVYRKAAEDRVSRPVADESATRADLAGAELDAIAEGLARLPKVTSRTVAWLATGLTGNPELPAKVLGDIATRTTMPVPLDGIVAGIRAFAEVRTPRQPS